MPRQSSTKDKADVTLSFRRFVQKNVLNCVRPPAVEPERAKSEPPKPDWPAVLPSGRRAPPKPPAPGSVVRRPVNPLPPAAKLRKNSW